jgi:hypothetical protein
MKVVISESQLDSFFSKLLKVPTDNSFMSKIKNMIGEDLDSIGRLILSAIKENKAEDITYEDTDTLKEFKHFYISKFPITITKETHFFDHSFHPYKYILKFRVIGTEGEISKSLGKKIWNSLIVE